MAPTVVHLSTIGPVTLHVGSARVAAGSHRPSALLLYMVVERGKEIPRRTLVELFFPDASESAGGHALRQLVYRLRQRGVALDGDGPTVSLAQGAATWDVEEVESRGHYSDKELESLGKGYLTDFAPRVSGAFAEWLDAHRSKVSTTLRRNLLAQMRAEKAKNCFAEVDRTARACLALDPLNEEATLAIAEALVMSGSKVEALSVLDRYMEEVGPRSRELRIAPKLLRERISDYVVDSGLLAEPPLVGRNTEMATLRALIARIGQGNAEACVLWGSSGIGKSRLVNEACSIAALQGLAVVRCALQPHDQRRPLAVLRDIASRLLDLPGAIGCAPESLAFVRGLCGRGEMPARELPRTTQDSEVALAAALASATDLLDAVAGERPLLLCVEDAHWLDSASIELIVEAVSRQRSLCILMASQKPLQLPDRLANAARLSSIEVPRLSAEASATLMRRLFERSGRALDLEFVEWALGLADGVPFYLQSLFVEYVTTGDRTAIPPTLTASLASKLERLGETTRSVFDAIVVLGTRCTLGHLETLMQLPRHALVTSLRELEERGLIRSMQSVVTCAHELFAVTARGKMPASVARMLHKAAAELLELDEQAMLSAPWDIAEHWAESGDPSRALVLIRRCAQEALRVGRPQDAVDTLSRVEGLPVAEEERRWLMEDVFQAYMAAGQSRRAADTIANLIKEETLRGRVPPIEWELALAESGYYSGLQNSPTDRIAEIALQPTAEPSFRLRAAKVLLFLAEASVDAKLARFTIDSISDLHSESADFLTPHLIYNSVFGEPLVAVSIAERLVALGESTKYDLTRYHLFYNSGIALWRAGLVEKATETLSRAYTHAETVRFSSGAVASASCLAEVHWHAENDELARHWFCKAASHLARISFPDHAYQHYAMAVMFALADGAPAEAERLHLMIGERYPALMQGRRAAEYWAYEVRIRLAKGMRPNGAEVERLVAAHLLARSTSAQDIVADTTIAALESIGQLKEATRLKEEYLFIWRRDRYSIPTHLASLQPRAD